MNLEEPLLFEIGNEQKSAIDLPEFVKTDGSRLGAAKRIGKIGLVGMSEPEIMRHYTRLSEQNYSVDSVFYPLGSCTMKYNPRINEKLCALEGFSDIHPLQPQKTVQGALKALYILCEMLKALTGMDSVAFSPAAGAQGELCGLMTIRAALTARGDAREVVLVPSSAHGTNPATATMCGYKIENIPVREDGRVDVDFLDKRLREGEKNVAAFMLTNPNTCGLFEKDILKIAELIHSVGAFFYMDGANFNAIMGIVKPADLGVDAMHINVHKTFSTPHGGGGPGAGPVVFAKELSPFRPLPWVEKDGEVYSLIEKSETSFGRMKEFNGQFSVLIRTLSYILTMGLDGIKQAAYDAVLNANYVKAKLESVLHLPFKETCMHEVLFDDAELGDLGITTIDIAKNLIEEGFHPMTIYFPLVVHGAMLIEPTETESKKTLDSFIDAIKRIVAKAKAGELEQLHNAPYSTPRRRLDETLAARSPKLKFEE